MTPDSYPSDLECVDYVFGRLTPEQEQVVHAWYEKDEIIHDFIDTVQEMKDQGNSYSDTLQEIESIPPPLPPDVVLGKIAETIFKEKYGEMNPN